MDPDDKLPQLVQPMEEAEYQRLLRILTNLNPTADDHQIVGNLMRATKGFANPATARRILADMRAIKLNY